MERHYCPYLRYFCCSLLRGKSLKCLTAVVVPLSLANCYSCCFVTGKATALGSWAGCNPQQSFNNTNGKAPGKCFSAFSEVALLQMFTFLAPPMDSSLMFCQHREKSTGRKAAFLPRRGCYLHGKTSDALCVFLVSFPPNRPRNSHWKGNVHFS